jgi:hypothetical protein
MGGVSVPSRWRGGAARWPCRRGPAARRSSTGMLRCCSSRSCARSGGCPTGTCTTGSSPGRRWRTAVACPRTRTSGRGSRARPTNGSAVQRGRAALQDGDRRHDAVSRPVRFRERRGRVVDEHRVAQGERRRDISRQHLAGDHAVQHNLSITLSSVAPARKGRPPMPARAHASATIHTPEAASCRSRQRSPCPCPPMITSNANAFWG